MGLVLFKSSRFTGSKNKSGNLVSNQTVTQQKKKIVTKPVVKTTKKTAV